VRSPLAGEADFLVRTLSPRLTALLFERKMAKDLQVPDPPVVANVVVYAIQTGEQTIQNPTRGDVTGLAPTTPPAAGRGPTNAAAAAAAAAQSAKFRATPVSNLVLYAFGDAQNRDSVQ